MAMHRRLVKTIRDLLGRSLSIPSALKVKLNGYQGRAHENRCGGENLSYFQYV